MPERPRVFGIGLHKTGTSSLHTALLQLGWRSLHNSRRVTAAVKKEREAGQPILSTLVDDYDALSDWPIYRDFEEIDKTYPGSKFVCTRRDLPSWISSRRRHAGPTHSWGDLTGAGLKQIHSSHHQRVLDYFQGWNDLLVYDICDGQGWEPLCRFLKVPVPDIPFPWRNASPVYDFSSEWFTKQIPNWIEWLADLLGQPKVRALEVGSFEGRNATWTLLNLCSHESARLSCVDVWFNSKAERRFDGNLAATGHSHKVRKYKESSRRVHARQPAGAGREGLHFRDVAVSSIDSVGTGVVERFDARIADELAQQLPDQMLTVCMHSVSPSRS